MAGVFLKSAGFEKSGWSRKFGCWNIWPRGNENGLPIG
jgi:hypothetical protein